MVLEAKQFAEGQCLLLEVQHPASLKVLKLLKVNHPHLLFLLLVFKQEHCFEQEHLGFLIQLFLLLQEKF